MTYQKLIAEHGSARAALEALPQIAREAGLDGYDICPEGVVTAELRAGARARARLLTQDCPDYPRALHDIDDAPPLLWMRAGETGGQRGTTHPNARPQIALVGARNASSLGLRMARRLATELGAAGQGVTSGLARGIDTAAHMAAVDTGTVAVVAGGVDVPYPPENAKLMDEIAEKGAVISEMPMGTRPQARHFPRRNRLVSGIAQAVVVVEAAAKSGSLITAQIALDQGREVLAVPGHPFDARAAGGNILIRDGATLVRSAADIAEALALPEAPPVAAPATAPAPRPQKKRSLRDIAQIHRAILDRLGPSPMAEDQIIRDAGAEAEQVSSALVDLELDGQIERQQGGLLALKGRA